MSPATKKHQQLILLEPEKAALLDALSAETRVPKQVLLRDAVDDLLAKHAKANTQWYAEIVAALRQGRAIANRLEQQSTEEPTWRAKCEEFRKRVRELLTILGKN